MGVIAEANKKSPYIQGLVLIHGGSGEIRTHERVAPSPVFKTGAFNRSATLPGKKRHYAIWQKNDGSIDAQH
jgi:hypothetical protein